jgi:hypothetical protein
MRGWYLALVSTLILSTGSNTLLVGAKALINQNICTNISGRIRSFYAHDVGVSGSASEGH